MGKRSHSLKSGVSRRLQYKEYSTQRKIVFHYLQKNIATASMVSEATGIPQKNITRHKRKLEKAGLLYELERRFCKITGYPAYYLTTNKELLPISNKNQ